MAVVALVGLPATGKTTVAEQLQQKYGWSLIDVDAEVERINGKTISALVEEEGIERFRDEETRAVRKALHYIGSKVRVSDEDIAEQHWVLSLGGGAFLRSENVELVKRSCKIVCLEASRKTILERVRRDELLASSQGKVSKRPLLASEKAEELEQKLEALIESRKGLFSIADMHIDTDAESIESICERIIAEA